MSKEELSELSQKLTHFQKEYVFHVLKKLSNVLAYEEEKDLGEVKSKKRLIKISGKNLKRYLGEDIDRELHTKIINLLVQEGILLSTENIIIETNEKEEERYGNTITLLFPANFEERRRAYEEKLTSPKHRAPIERVGYGTLQPDGFSRFIAMALIYAIIWPLIGILQMLKKLLDAVGTGLFKVLVGLIIFVIVGAVVMFISSLTPYYDNLMVLINAGKSFLIPQ